MQCWMHPCMHHAPMLKTDFRTLFKYAYHRLGRHSAVTLHASFRMLNVDAEPELGQAQAVQSADELSTDAYPTMAVQ